ncbi:type II and III secretion system protein family protein [Sphingobium sufflavum]|uniref:type II and III secretion system protein family protein n=1 Tax=Sphingobium sufflavum TaxID=1129547 RepID=UPI001F386EFF|nr:type II and III secretion system protein family protein [Sphingobium sufflavum]MCE7795849.1 type II and III secretion system protein family protein [Sphingobium sufflavum]
MTSTTLRTMGLRSLGRNSLAASAALILTAAPLPSLAAGRAPTAPAAPAVRDDGVQLLSLGQSKVINLATPMSDVIIANPDVVDVHVRSSRQLYLIPKGPGQTDLTVTNTAGKPIYRAVVRVGNNLTSIDQMLRLAMPDADIQVSTLNNTVLLTGIIATPEDSAEAERLVTAFVGDKTTVISRLKTATPLAVNLQVRIAEVSKTISKTIGMNLATADYTSGFKFGLGSGGRTMYNPKWYPGGSLAAGTNLVGSEGLTGIPSKTSGTTIAADTSLFGLNILAALDLAEDQGLATTLANPNLTALSGETASFLAGGELPIPLSTGLGQTSVEFKSYGVSLAFTPTVLADGRISMRVRPEVSDLDYTAGVTISGTAIPGVKTRRAETTLEMGSGQSMMIGGLLRSENSNSINKAPFLGDIPILGNLFKSSAFRRSQTELVIIVTPYLVKPVNARDIKLPTDGYRNANDAQRYLGTMQHDSKSNEPRPVPTLAPPVIVPADSTAAPVSGGTPRKPGKANAAPGFSF